MKKNFTKLVVLCLMAISPHWTFAQVTIGSAQPPADGALLDLKTETNNSSRLGLALPRVVISNLKPTTPSELAKSIGENTVNYDLSSHIGLVVYNVKEDDCPVDRIYGGLYVWNGTTWELLGSPNSSSDVSFYEDTRKHGGALAGTTQTYPYRNFGDAGEWMLENMRYIPASNEAVQILPGAGDEGELDPTQKYYAYPQTNATLTPSQAGIKPAYWQERFGLLYTFSAATLGLSDKIWSGSLSSVEGVQGICPPGWHIPTNKEWNRLIAEIYANSDKYSTQPVPASPSEDYPTAGTSLKSVCILPNVDIVNPDTGGKSFSAIQGGFNVFLTGDASKGKIDNYGSRAAFWSSSKYFSTTIVEVRAFSNSDQKIGVGGMVYDFLLSVRCKR